MNKLAIYRAANHLMHFLGLDLRRFPTADQRRLLNYLRANGVDACIDVGANTGQFALALREIGYSGEIFSVEPQSVAYAQLEKKTRRDKHWRACHFALGDYEGSGVIHISKNSASSSLLDYQNDISVKAEESTAFIGNERVDVTTFEKMLLKNRLQNRRIFLKIDAQGFEKKVLDGVRSFWPIIYALQIELSFTQIYQGESSSDDLKKFIESKDFYLSSIESGFADFESGRLLQADAVFVRNIEN